MAQFELTKAKRGLQPIFCALIGPSGGGKTYSALRLATGIQRVCPGSVAMIDTEADRGLVYADKFDYEHMSFGPPFSPDRYREAIEFCVSKGAKTLIVDSFSHEHEGQGGVLEIHDREVESMGKGSEFRAWAKPKGMRRAMIQRILQLKINLIACFRAQPKVALQDDPHKRSWPWSRGAHGGKKTPTDIGWVAITDSKMLFEFPSRFLLLGNCDGRPTWQSELEGEQNMMRRPSYFRKLFADDVQLSEAVGEAMARWSAGQNIEQVKTEAHPLEAQVEEWIAAFAAVESAEAIDRIVAQAEPHRKSMTARQRDRFRAAKSEAEIRVSPETTRRDPRGDDES